MEPYKHDDRSFMRTSSRANSIPHMGKTRAQIIQHQLKLHTPKSLFTILFCFRFSDVVGRLKDFKVSQHEDVVQSLSLLSLKVILVYMYLNLINELIDDRVCGLPESITGRV